MAPMGGPVAISQEAIHKAMELYEVEHSRDTFEKVLAVSRHFIGKMA